MKKLIILLLSVLSLTTYGQVNVNAKQYRFINNTDSTGLGSITGIVRYDPVTGLYRFYNALTSTWFSYSRANVTFGLVDQLPITNSTVDGYNYSANLTYNISNNNFRAARSFTDTNTGTKNNNVVIGESSRFEGLLGNIKWSKLITEQGILVSNGSSGVIHNASIDGGFNNKIEKQSGFNSFSCSIYGSNSCYIGASTSSTTSSLIFSARNDTILNASSAIGLGYRAKVTGDGALGHGFFDTYSGGTHTGTIVSCEIAGKGAFGFFTNTSAAAAGKGVQGAYGVALGGWNPYIPATSSRNGILGGNGIEARAGEDDQWYVPNFNIDSEPVHNDTLDQVMVRYRGAGKRGQLQWRSASTIGGSGISGLTTNRVTYATSATTIGDDAGFVYDATNNAATIDDVRIHGTTTDNTFVGTNSGNFTLSGTNNTGVGEDTHQAATSGSLNSAVGSNALRLNQSGNANTAFGYNALASNVSGLSNTAVGSTALAAATGSTNIGVGAQAGDNISSGNNNIVIGAQLDAQSATANNQLVIQGIIFGTGNSATGTNIASGSIGIGTASPDRRFHVESNTADSSSVVYPNRITSLSTAVSPDNGFGAGIEFEVETTTSNNEVGATIDAVTTDVTAASEDFDVVIKNMSAGAAASETLRVTSTGNVLTTFSGTQYTLDKSNSNTATLDFPSIASLGVQSLTITVTGAADGDLTTIGIPSASFTAGLVFTSRVSATNTIEIQVYNSTIAAIDPASGVFKASYTK